MLFADYALRIKRFPEQKRNKNLIVENVEKQWSANDSVMLFENHTYFGSGNLKA